MEHVPLFYGQSLFDNDMMFYRDVALHVRRVQNIDYRAADFLLSGIRIVEFGGSVAGPYGTWILASLGATVLKIERPDSGDDCRAWAPAKYNGFGSVFTALNAGKHSIEIDLKDPEQKSVLRKFMIEDADIVIQNMRPGFLESIGFGADDLMAENERLIYCSNGAFGRAGPLSDRPGYDPLMQAFGGIMSVTGEEGGPPVRVGTSIIDMGSGMWCAIGILAALRNRDIKGKGERIDASLFETSLGWMTYHSAAYCGEKKIGIRRGSSGVGIVPYQAYPCLDGYLVIAAGNDRLFRKLTQAFDQPQWPDDSRFATNPKRLENKLILNELIEQITITQAKAHWQKKLDDANVPNAPLQNIEEIVHHPQTEAVGMIQETDDGQFKLMGLPLSFDGIRPPQRRGPPNLGQDTAKFFAGVFNVGSDDPPHQEETLDNKKRKI